MKFSILLLVALFFITEGFAQDKAKEKKISPSSFSALKFRSIGPACASGRIADLEVNPKNSSEYYVAVAAGHVWKTTNSGITYKPIFDKYGSYSIADVAIDPSNTNIVWVGTGEYNSQRAIGYGDGVYVSFDAGKSFKNVGLKKSEHIGRIVIDPRNSHVYVAAQGPLWGDGGERGLYKTTDFGKTWTKILNVSDKTGITDIVYDPRNPDVLYCASYQRRRRVFTLIDGGKESAIYKSVDAGKTWNKLKSGLPSGDVGRIGLAISPVDPDYIYAIIEAASGQGFYRSIDRGASWTKMSSYMSSSPQYYNRIHCDPIDKNKVFSTETVSKYTINGGKKWTSLGLSSRHVDDHALWIDPKNTNHLIIGGDGGIYESFDLGTNWRHVPNLPVTQFYRVAVDNSYPFYNICGGTQDNNSLLGPSQTINKHGILNSDWNTTVGGDGFFSLFDPVDSDIVYSESQHGGLVRYDKKTREAFDIKPSPPLGEKYVWNWNSPLLISKFNHKTLYFASNKLLKSEDRGNSWKEISPDLTRQLNRNELKVMGKVQSPEAVAKNKSTSIFGNIVSLSESPKKQGLLYVGTDDGLIQVTENDGKTWNKYENFGNFDKMTYVSCLFASRHNENVVFASFDGRKNNDLKPYIFISKNKGKTWQSIISNLPERGTVFSINQDTKDPNLLFVGTEFGIFFSQDKGKKWIQLKSGIPTIAVRDIKIQEREEDLVLATFGRGFYILDDYSILRTFNENEMDKDAVLYPIKDALAYSKVGPQYGQGATYYGGKNPEYGAVFTYYIKDTLATRKSIRKNKEKEQIKAGKDIKYPSLKELELEKDEIKPFFKFIIKNSAGETVRTIKVANSSGLHRVNWGLRSFYQYPIYKANSKKHSSQNKGMPVMPGKYSVYLVKVINDVETKITDEISFNVKILNNATIPATDRKALADFQADLAKIYGASKGLSSYIDNLDNQSKTLKTALQNTSKTKQEHIALVNKYIAQIRVMKRKLSGNEVISAQNEAQTPSINSRLGNVFYNVWQTSSEPTQTMRMNVEISKTELKKLIEETKVLSTNVEKLKKVAESLGAPNSILRIPELK